MNHLIEQNKRLHCSQLSQLLFYNKNHLSVNDSFYLCDVPDKACSLSLKKTNISSIIIIKGYRIPGPLPIYYVLESSFKVLVFIPGNFKFQVQTPFEKSNKSKQFIGAKSTRKI